MVQPELRNTQIKTGTDIGDIIKVVDVGSSTAGLPNIDGSQVLDLSAGNITSGALNDSVVAESNITQHESAITITESQITDDNIFARLSSDESILGLWSFDNQLVIQSTGTPVHFAGTKWVNTDTGSNWTLTLGPSSNNFVLGYSPDTDPTQPVMLFTSSEEVVVGDTIVNNGAHTLTAQNGVYDGDGSRVFSPNNPDTWIIVSSATSATNGDKLLTDTSGGAFTITLPSTVSDGDFIMVADPTTSWNTNNLTIDGGGNNIEGSTTFNATTDDGAFHIIYNGTQWIVRFGP